jgi:hypothetical protein
MVMLSVVYAEIHNYVLYAEGHYAIVVMLRISILGVILLSLIYSE